MFAVRRPKGNDGGFGLRLLLDDNLSPKLVALLRAAYPDITHVHSIGLGAASDTEIWRWAKANDYLICTKDSDFYHQAILQGPPKVIWLKLGNCFTKAVEQELTGNLDRIRQFADDHDQKVLILGERTSGPPQK